jgi:hypothetical protein
MSVLRGMGLLSLVAALAIGGLTFKGGALGGGSSGDTGGSSPLAQIEQALFAGADVSLASYRATSGTFVGAPAPVGVTVVRADETSYCIQADQGTVVAHEVGPGGQVQRGPCP